MFDLTKPVDGTAATLLTLLTPGLLAFVVFRSVSRRKEKIETVDAVLVSLALTLVVQAMWSAAKMPGSYFPTPDSVGLCLCSLITALLMIVLEDRGIVHKILNLLGVSRHAPWATIWLSAFRQFHPRSYVVLHLNDGRRAMGIVRGCSEEQKDGHVVIEHCSWINGDSFEPATGVLMFPADDISFVEFLPPATGDRNGQSASKSSNATSTSTGRSERGLVGTGTACTTAAASSETATAATIIATKIDDNEID